MSEFEAARLVLDFTALACSAGAVIHTHVRMRHAAREREVAILRERLTRVEARLNEAPSSKALHELSVAIERLGGDLKATVARMDGLGEIVKRLDRITERQESYLLGAKP